MDHRAREDDPCYTQLAVRWPDAEAPSASVATMSSMNWPTNGPSPKSQGMVPENNHDPLASVVAKSGMSVLPVNGLLISTCSVIELVGWNPVPTADATQPGQSPETPTVSEGPAGAGGAGGT